MPDAARCKEWAAAQNRKGWQQTRCRTRQDEFNKGISAYQNEQYVNAEKHFQNVLRLDPTLADAELNLALALYKQNKITHADQHFDRAQRLYREESGMGSGSGAKQQ